MNAKSPSLASDTTITFSATALVGAAKTIAQQSGNAQVGQIGELMNPFVVQVSDTGGNFVPNALVTFTIIERPAFTGHDSLTATQNMTDAAGQASTALILGDRQGRYTVRASISWREGYNLCRLCNYAPCRCEP